MITVKVNFGESTDRDRKAKQEEHRPRRRPKRSPKEEIALVKKEVEAHSNVSCEKPEEHEESKACEVPKTPTNARAPYGREWRKNDNIKHKPDIAEVRERSRTGRMSRVESNPEIASKEDDVRVSSSLFVSFMLCFVSLVATYMLTKFLLFGVFI